MITRAFFSNKRKMINKAYLKTFQNNFEIAKRLGINLKSRPSELSCETYYKMTETYEKFKRG